MRQVNVGRGDALQLDPKGDKSYRIYWQSAVLEYTQKGASAGSMKTVHGEIYDAGRVTSTFEADHGIADKAANLLKLSGRVHVHSPGQPATEGTEGQSDAIDLYCDNLEWHTDVKIIKAIGAVTVKTEAGGKVGPMDELWSTVDMNKVGSDKSLKVKAVGTPGGFENQ